MLYIYIYIMVIYVYFFSIKKKVIYSVNIWMVYSIYRFAFIKNCDAYDNPNTQTLSPFLRPNLASLSLCIS